MDETPIFFDMVGNTTIEVKGSKTVEIRSTENNKNRFTCVLTVLADGTKLPPMVIFKGKCLPPNLPSEIIKKSLLVLDSFKAHKTPQIKLAFKDENSNLAVTPGRLTSIVQPLDVCLNKPFKDRLRVKWCQWMAVGNFDLTKGGNIKKPGYNVICNWILEAWDSIPKEMVLKNVVFQILWMEWKII
ncbi:9949_t:CDS:2 [Diversispora eburnea]|uniref:9949_t:CDS:1 n=1 Tax=Diversispora eburnea TaxID=1213867 RepID=A0A9N8VE39_9GLOM|nr:9949_t:CDS:2 [Diversispora eburnea]